MKKLTYFLSISLLAMALFFTVPARAQDVDNNAGTQSGVADVDDDDDGMDWGWLGLLGLIGLYGLKGKDRDHQHTNTTVNR